MMYWYGNGGMSGWGWALATIGMVVFWGVLITAGVALFRYLSRSPQQPPATPGAPQSPEAILAERFARGEIDENEYRDRLAALHGGVRS